MPAKDIIDIDIEYERGSLARLIEDLVALGYVHEGDKGIATREAFAQTGGPARAQPKHHLYACEEDSPELTKHLAFRRFLIENPDRAAWLAIEKRRCDLQATTRDEYTLSKSGAYQTVLKEAVRCLT